VPECSTGSASRTVQQQVGIFSGGFSVSGSPGLGPGGGTRMCWLLVGTDPTILDAQCIEWLQDQLERLGSGALVLGHPRPATFPIGFTRRIVEVDRGESAPANAGNYRLPADKGR